MIRKTFKIISMIILLMLSSNITFVYADSKQEIQDQIEENNSEKKELEQKISDEQKRYNEIQEQVSEQSQKLQKAIEDVRIYQNKIDLIQHEINGIENSLIKSENLIEHKNNLIKEKEKIAKEANEVLRERVRTYYKIDMTSHYLYIILNSKNILEVFNNISNVVRLANMDKKLISESEKIKKELNREVELVKIEMNRLEDEKSKLDVKKSDLTSAQQEYIDIKNSEQYEMDKLSKLEQEKSEIITSLKGEIESIEDETEELQSELDNISNNAASSNQPNIPSESGFIRPVDGRISSPFGYRIHPITGEKKLHKGIDFANGYGAPIKAAKSGTVGYAGWMSGYGKVVIINHGNGQQTVYAHTQAIYVSVGDAVSQGQVIAEVGSTGNSTGPHLHFEIRINGQCVDPMNYL